MYGAILGDIIGSPYEFRSKSMKSKGFPLFDQGCRFTDDSVMTTAVAEALLDAKADGCLDDEAKLKDLFIDSMQKWGHRYPRAGYGRRFYHWLARYEKEPYNSLGNGSGMRVSPAGWVADDLEKTRAIARWSAEVTHNHPEGVKGAEAVASAIFLARTGHSKDEIRKYVAEEFGYDLDRTCDEIRPNYRFDVTCMGSVPESIIAFLEGNDFEDVIRTAVSLGGDTDTMGAMAGSIAEAFYGVPEELKAECERRIPSDMREILEEFSEEIMQE